MGIVMRGKLRKSGDSIVYEFKGLNDLADGEYSVHIIEIDTTVKQGKKAYFAMVDELARNAGYLSHQDRTKFKQQVRKELGDESIAEMTTIEEVWTKIEELQELARIHYDYIFLPYLKPPGNE